MLLAVICLGRRTNMSRSDSRTSSFYKPHGTIRSRQGAVIEVSQPIPMTDQPPRTDFLRRTTSKARSLFSGRSRSSFLQSEGNWKMPTPPESNNIPAVPGGRTYPTTPPRPDREAYRSSGTESITIYSPPHGQLSKDITPISTAVSEPRAAPPLPTIGSPFKTPPSKEPLYHGALASAPQGETLTPARYNDGKRRQGADSDISRPTTIFTTMLHDIGFPDPIGRPSVPAVPSAYDSKRARGR